MSEVRVEDEDPILPLRILHNCEQILDGDVPEQEYNYLVYEFETGEHSYWARAYLDDISEVSIFGPFLPNTREPAPGNLEIDERIVAYFRRRFPKLKKFCSKGYERIK